MKVFNEERIALVVVGNTVCLQKSDDKRTCQVWMQEELHLSESDCETFTCGYILDKRIQFFTGGERCTVSDKVTADVIRGALDAWQRLHPDSIECLGIDDFVIGNGCHVGKPGDQWPPVMVFDDGVWKLAE